MELSFSYEKALLWIVLLPLVGAVANGLCGRFASRRLVTAVAVGSVASAFVLALAAFVELTTLPEGERITYDAFEWFSLQIGAQTVPVHVRFGMDALSGTMVLVVTGIGLLIHIYSTAYMEEDPGYARFFAYLNLFTASMLILVLATSLPVMFVGWEGVGLCSYLLIGFWWENTDYAKAGRKAFIVNRIGDFGVIVGMFILVSSAGSFEFSELNRAASSLGMHQWFLFGSPVATVATAACLFLFLGCAGKSAQIPLYVWLPDAMAGPTPVSALIHAATMVTAGVYLCCRLSAVFLQSAVALAAIAIIGALTALLAASIAIVQNEMKKILAYSTVSQLGFMFAAVGMGAFAAGIFHVYTHAFFKACLFLGAGSVMHAVGAHGDADIRRLGGLRRALPVTHITFGLATAAIAGIPFLSGFFSKDEILLAAVRNGTSSPVAGWPSWFAGVGWAVFAMLVVAATMTAFYMFRLYLRTFSGTYRSAEGSSAEGHPYAAHPHEAPAAMRLVLVALAVGAVIAGYVNLEPLHLHFNLWGAWLGSALTEADFGEHAGSAPWIAMAGGLFAAFAGLGAAWVLYARRAEDVLPEKLPATLYRFLFDKCRVDELYDFTVVRPIRALSRLSASIDAVFVDGLLVRLTSAVARGLGWLLSRAQTGVVYTYGAAIAVGTLVFGWWFTFPHVDLTADVDGRKVSASTHRGLGYAYRWDLDGDGTFDTDWEGSAHTTTHTYGEVVPRILGVILEGRGLVGPIAEEIEIGDRFEAVPDAWLGLGWHRVGKPKLPPAVKRDGDLLVLRPNGARVRLGGQDLFEDEVRLRPGERVVIGDDLEPRTLRAVVMVDITVQARSAFGQVRSETVRIPLDQPSRPSAGFRAEAALPLPEATR